MLMNFLKKRPYIFFLAPALIAYTLFAIYPMISAFAISFTEWNGISPQVFVGFNNYVEVFTNAQFYNQFINALTNNLTIIALNFTITVPFQLFIAYNIYSKIKGHNFFQVIIYAPQFVLSPIIYIFFIFSFDGNIGMFNQFLGIIGLEQFQRPWLGTPGLGMFFVWLMGVFAGLGVSMLFFVGAMKMLDYATIESAKIDGAGYWYILIKIVLPQIKTTIFNVYILSYIFSMTAFDYSFILGGGRGMGGLNGAYDVLTLVFYRVAFGSVSDMGGSFQFNSLGMGTTIACLLFLIIGVISFFQIRLTFKSLEEDSSTSL
jgi:ABC-type sugar transport system permease subunit